ncbi:unnamed protein product, partial [Phaeothamnion confervicola]
GDWLPSVRQNGGRLSFFSVLQAGMKVLLRFVIFAEFDCNFCLQKSGRGDLTGFEVHLTGRPSFLSARFCFLSSRQRISELQEEDNVEYANQFQVNALVSFHDALPASLP